MVFGQQNESVHHQPCNDQEIGNYRNGLGELHENDLISRLLGRRKEAAGWNCGRRSPSPVARSRISLRCSLHNKLWLVFKKGISLLVVAVQCGRVLVSLNGGPPMFEAEEQ